MTKVSVNLQDSFLNQVRKDNAEIKIIMLDGSVLTGFVKGFDNFTIILNSKNSQHLIYKHAVSQLISRKPIQRAEQGEKKDFDKDSQGEVIESEVENEHKNARAFVPNLHPQVPSPKKAENFNPIDISNIKK